jgi:hypothetical protein
MNKMVYNSTMVIQRQGINGTRIRNIDALMDSYRMGIDIDYWSVEQSSAVKNGCISRYKKSTLE